MADETLVMLLDEIRGKTLQVLEGVTAAEARWAPPGLQNTILWHAGHSQVVVETLTLGALGERPEIPLEWFGMFSWESRPALVPPDAWPTLEDVVAELRAQHRRLRGVVAGLNPEQLAAPSRRSPERSVRYSILHGLHDEARHSGEISLLRKLQAAAAR
jgi:hypothetical protein